MAGQGPRGGQPPPLLDALRHGGGGLVTRGVPGVLFDGARLGRSGGEIPGNHALVRVDPNPK